LVLLKKQVAEQQMSIDVRRLESQGTFGMFHRFRNPAQRNKRKAHVLMEICVSLIQGQRSSEHVLANFGTAHLDGDEGESMEASDMLWAGGQGLLIEIHCLDQLPCLEVLNALREQERGRNAALIGCIAGRGGRFEPG